MNFLAHLFLAEDKPAALVGSLLPDLMRVGRGAVMHGYPTAMRRAIVQHRQVDAFTDAHPMWHRTRVRLRARHGIYAGILVDVFYDHFLAQSMAGDPWNPLGEFTGHVYRSMASAEEFVPAEVRPVLERMAAQDWLCSYATMEGIELALRRMSERLSRRFAREIRLETAMEDLREAHAEMRGDFDEFFPQLVQATAAAEVMLA